MIPRIVIAGTHSGCGKTTVASGIMAALTARGMTVQPFKVGPDFIDPSHHTKICTRPSRNLDPYMMGEEGCLETFTRSVKGADIAVIEGVMGLFDGIDGSDISSTAHVARILKSPVILVVDVKGMSRSVHALIGGFREYDPGLCFAGVIFNRIGSDRHQQMIRNSAEVPDLGWIPRNADLGMKSRHLGLVMAHESESLGSSGEFIENNTDLDRIIAAARTAPTLPPFSLQSEHVPDKVRIGIAYDNAFCFYYQDNLDKIRDAGADLVYFSPLDSELPPVDGVYFGGGYPELHLPALESSSCTHALKRAVDRGLPVYAECGGLMYLTREIQDDRSYRMAGILPADVEMTGKIQALGYVKGSVVADSSILSHNLIITGHEFHYSRLLPEADARYAIALTRGKGIEASQDGIISENALGTYTHAYFTRKTASDLVASALRFSRN